MTLDDELASGKARAKSQAGLYRELAIYSLPPEVSQHVATRLTQLQQIDPTISSDPLGDVHLGANNRPSATKLKPPCGKCNLTPPCFCD